MSDFRRLYLHELAHSVCAAQLGGTSTIIDEGDGKMRTETTWPDGDPSEAAVCFTWVAGPLLVPECASGEDKIMLAVMPRELRQKAEHFVRTYTIPAIAAIPPNTLQNMLEDMMWRGRVTIEPDGDPIGRGLPS